MITSEQKNLARKSVERLNADQKSVSSKLLVELKAVKFLNLAKASDRNVISLQVRIGTSKCDFFPIVQQCAESEGHITLKTNITGLLPKAV